MILAKENVSVGDVVIFRLDESRNGYIQEFDGHVQIINEKGIDILYLCGHKSQNDFIEWNDVLAKVELSQPKIRLKNAPYSGNFIVFNDTQTINDENK
jgi:hypothetical protein